MALASLANVTPAVSKSLSICVSPGPQKAEPEARVMCPKHRDQKLQRRSVGAGPLPAGSHCMPQGRGAPAKLSKRSHSSEWPIEDIGFLCLASACPFFPRAGEPRSQGRINSGHTDFSFQAPPLGDLDPASIPFVGTLPRPSQPHGAHPTTCSEIPHSPSTCPTIAKSVQRVRQDLATPSSSLQGGS